MSPTERFSSRVADYIRYRPGYPEAVVDLLRAEIGLPPTAVIADIGSGTGLSSALFLRHGHTVYGVEPNAEMRSAAEELLRDVPHLHSVAGTAEATALPDCSIDLVVAGQAFHWFDRPQARREFARILRPGGCVVLLWNTRRLGSPFADAYEELLRTYGTDYGTVRHENLGPNVLADLFAGSVTRRVLPNEQHFDLDGLTGRLQSSSYVPPAGHPHHAPMVAALGQLFAEHARDGRVRFAYDTEVYFGRLE